MTAADELEEQAMTAGVEDPSEDMVAASVVPSGPAGALGVVAVVAFLINALSLSASQLWICPDSLRHIEMGVAIAEGFDFSSQSFLFHQPGYPALLAGIFLLFGSQSPDAILVIQHVMALGAALLTALIGWHLTQRAAVALLSGLLCAGSLQVLAYANVVMSEVPYTFTLIASVYFLVKYHRVGGLPFLGWASLMAGVSYLFQPGGLLVLVFCLLAGIHRAWPTIRYHATSRRTLRAPAQTPGQTRTAEVVHRVLAERSGVGPGEPAKRLAGLFTAICVAILPGLAVVAPYMIHKAAVHDGHLLSHSVGFALYDRAARYDRLPLNLPNSAALREVRAVVEEAKRLGHLDPQAYAAEAGSVCKAYTSVNDAPFPEACVLVGRAAWDLIREHPRVVAERTMRRAAWMLLVPDSTYRFLPGGVEGSRGKRDEEADIFDISTYQSSPEPYGNRLAELVGYLPLKTEPGITTPLWTEVTRRFYHHVDTGPQVPRLGYSPYQVYVFLCVFGGVCSLLIRSRMTWLLVGGVIAAQVVGSAFLGVWTPRHGVPIHPLMNLFAALVLVTAVQALAWPVLRFARRPAYTGGPEEIAGVDPAKT